MAVLVISGWRGATATAGALSAARWCGAAPRPVKDQKAVSTRDAIDIRAVYF